MEQLAQLVTAVSSLPPQINPYTAFIAQLKHVASPGSPSYFPRLIKANYAVGAVGLLAGLIAIAAKATNGGIWIARKRHTEKGYLLTPNTTFLLCVVHTLYFSVALASDYFVLQAFEHGQTIVNYKRLMGILWPCIVFAVLIEASGMCSAAILSVQWRNNSETRPWSFARIGSKIPSWVINALFIAAFPITAAIVLPIFAYFSHKVTLGWNSMEDLFAQIEPTEAAWTEGSAFVLDPTWIPGLQDFTSKLNTAADWIGYGFVVYGLVLLSITIFAFVPSAFGYLGMLKGQLSAYNTQASSNQSQLRSVRNTYRMMAAESIGVFLLSSIYVVAALLVGFRTRFIIESRTNLPMVLSIAYWSYSSIVTPLNVLLAWRALRPILRRRHYGQRRATDLSGITVNTTVEKHVDVGDFDDNRNPCQYNAPFKPSSASLPLSRRRASRPFPEQTVVNLGEVRKEELDEKDIL